MSKLMVVVDILNILIWSWNIYAFGNLYRKFNIEIAKVICVIIQLISIYIVAISVGDLIQYVV